MSFIKEIVTVEALVLGTLAALYTLNFPAAAAAEEVLIEDLFLEDVFEDVLDDPFDVVDDENRYFNAGMRRRLVLW